MYFSLESVLRKFDIDRKKMYYDLAKSYFLEDNHELEELFILISSDKISELITLEDYNRNARIGDYCRIMDIPINLTEQENSVLCCKGMGIRRAHEARLLSNYEIVPEETQRLLNEKASNGDIWALIILGFMLLKGLGIKKDIEMATQYLLNAAKWNNLDAVIILLSNNLNDTMQNLSYLKVKCKDNFVAAIDDIIIKKYPEFPFIEENNGLLLISKYIAAYPDTKGRYDSRIARIAYSSILTSSDKLKLMFSESRELVNLANNLPLKENRKFGKISIPCYSFENIVLHREDEINQIWKKICNFDNEETLRYKPALLICEDEYVLEMYKTTITNAMGNCIRENIDARNLSLSDVSSTTDNIIVSRIIDSKKLNSVFFFDNAEQISEEVIDNFIKMLTPNYMRKFKMNNVNITLDLSSIFIVITSCGKVDSRIGSACETITLSTVKEEEKTLVFNAEYSRYRNQFNNLLIIEDDIKIKICEYNAKTILNILYELICLKKAEKAMNRDEKISEQTISKYAEKHISNQTPFGFGGTL
jgi:hypothetical protein